MVTVYDSGYLFRYVDDKELCFILKNGFVYSTKPHGDLLDYFAHGRPLRR